MYRYHCMETPDDSIDNQILMPKPVWRQARQKRWELPFHFGFHLPARGKAGIFTEKGVGHTGLEPVTSCM